MTPDRLTTRMGGAAALDLTSLAGLRSVVSVKAFLAHALPGVASSPGQLVTVLAAARAAGVPVVVHAEFGEVISALEGVFGPPGDLESHSRLRSAELEAACVAMVAAIAHDLDASVYIAHVSDPLVVAAAAQARERGARIRLETCPHYLELETRLTPDVVGRVTPPLRTRATAERMRQLVTTHSLDVIASDHCGYSMHEKPADDFASAGNGLPGLDSMLSLALDAVLDPAGWLDSVSLVRTLCRAPADTFGLPSKGRLEVAADADLVVVDPAGSTELARQPGGPSRAVSPYAGRRLRGAITDVVRRGLPVVRDGQRTDVRDGAPVARGDLRW